MISSDGERRDGTPCSWKGIEFLSHLEREYAQFFESRLPGQWLYEPYAFAVRTKSWKYRRQRYSRTTWWVPDFLVEGIGVIEIKPTVAIAHEESRKITLFASAFPGCPLWVFAGRPHSSDVLWAHRGERPTIPLEFRLSEIPTNNSVVPYTRGMVLA